MHSNTISNSGRIVHKTGCEPHPGDPLGQRLCQIFSYMWQAILAPNQPSPDWKTLTQHPLRPRTLWAKWQDAAKLVGVRFRDLTVYALLDIDCGSAYCNSASIRGICYALETIGITRTILVRSSFSGGFHLYIPLGVEVPTFGLASAIKQTLEAQGLTVAPGQLEIFPNCKTYAIPGTFTEYNAHRLPLQPASGSCLLDGDCQPEAYGDGYNGLREFLQRWDVAASAQDLDLLRQAIAQVLERQKTYTPEQLYDSVEEKDKSRFSQKGQACGWIETRLGNTHRDVPSTSEYFCYYEIKVQKTKRKRSIYLQKHVAQDVRELVNARSPLAKTLQIIRDLSRKRGKRLSDNQGKDGER